MPAKEGGNHWVEMFERGQWSALLLRPAILWALMGSFLLAFRTSLWLRYRPFPAAAAAYAGGDRHRVDVLHGVTCQL